MNSAETTTHGLRLPVVLMDRLKSLATLERRSVNGEIVHRLTQSCLPRQQASMR